MQDKKQKMRENPIIAPGAFETRQDGDVGLFLFLFCLVFYGFKKEIQLHLIAVRDIKAWVPGAGEGGRAGSDGVAPADTLCEAGAHGYAVVVVVRPLEAELLLCLIIV